MSSQAEWMEQNDRQLTAAVARIRHQLEQLARPVADDDEKKEESGWFNWSGQDTPPAQEEEQEENAVKRQQIALEDRFPPALTLLAKSLGLSEFEQNILLLCAAMELDTRIAALCAKVQGNEQKPYPTFALCLVLFADPDWQSLSPRNPLRHWRLLEIHQSGIQPLTGAALTADERIVNFLKGINYLDDRLTAVVEPMGRQQMDNGLPSSQQENVDRIVHGLQATDNNERTPVIELLGHDTVSKELIAGQAAAALGLNLYAVDLKTLPAELGELETFTRLWQRESLLLPLALYIRIDGAAEAEQSRLRRFLERSSGVIFLDLEDGKTASGRNSFSLEVSKPSPEEQEQLWTELLHGRTEGLPQRLAEQFSFGAAEIRRLAGTALEQAAQNEQSAGGKIWQLCRLAARSGMEQLAQRIEVKADWDRLVLPLEQKDLLCQIIDQVAQRNRVYEDWGFRQQMNRGLGINALFTGPSGTGKTMAAEVIANELNLDLFRIDLSSVVSKYIGETEKNLRKLFDTAEDSGAILFFDEADALFGKRSEVKDSHDRYANIEINYLLQRIETYRGLAILASNVRTALDKAFTRRLRFIVEFPFPGLEQRREIWEKVFPAATPKADTLDYERLARLNLTGGNIHNVALNSAFLAAQKKAAGEISSPQDTECKVTMGHILAAARMEYRKLDRSLNEADFRWQEPTGGEHEG